eukprot:485519-Prymnesium_polylepis.1
MAVGAWRLRSGGRARLVAVARTLAPRPPHRMEWRSLVSGAVGGRHCRLYYVADGISGSCCRACGMVRGCAMGLPMATGACAQSGTGALGLAHCHWSMRGAGARGHRGRPGRTSRRPPRGGATRERPHHVRPPDGAKRSNRLHVERKREPTNDVFFASGPLRRTVCSTPERSGTCG